MKCSDACKYLFKIGEHEFKTYLLLTKKPYRVEEIAEKTGKDRSTVQRYLKKLMKCGMAKRKRRLIRDGGGHYYIYYAVPPDELIALLDKCLKKWYQEMKKAIRNF